MTPPLLLNARLQAAHRWREQYNPLRGLTLPLALNWLEQAQRGWFADLQWAYFFIEQTDADLLALVERRTSAILALDWDIQIAEPERAGFDAPLAAEQAGFLRSAYEDIDNLYEAIDHLAMASFRGFAHLEKHPAPGGLIGHLELLDQWNVVRDGLRGPWKYNPEARSCDFSSLPAASLIPPDQWIIREVKRPVDRIGLIKFIRSNLCQRDWDAFVEIYGLPGAIITGPPNLPPDQETQLAAQALDIAEGGSGYLPNGSAVQFSEGPRLHHPFRDYLHYWQEQLVLAGTGGLLTMLTASGTGTLAGSVHEKSFEQIARSEARRISEVFQKQMDAALLAVPFPGRPALAYFRLDTPGTQNVNEVVDQTLKLKQAGYTVEPAELSERTGYSLTQTGLPDAIQNRSNSHHVPASPSGSQPLPTFPDFSHYSRNSQLAQPEF